MKATMWAIKEKMEVLTNSIQFKLDEAIKKIRWNMFHHLSTNRYSISVRN
jgi:hypothetical protein